MRKSRQSALGVMEVAMSLCIWPFSSQYTSEENSSCASFTVSVLVATLGSSEGLGSTAETLRYSRFCVVSAGEDTEAQAAKDSAAQRTAAIGFSAVFGVTRSSPCGCCASCAWGLGFRARLR